ncbi:hypothetical protein QBC34DRAFT_75580 [Podospora aff. communis PSN243]|uniref:Uncharacterized protein n=1 Tax=Podospora aff. communis PSN243 TaxID=3040156 RepID=A0AAV9GQS5_9PEZI|nr:hypothetical protein QBC34DRAFT_75580 [Podospora aff. communis PSN243]
MRHSFFVSALEAWVEGQGDMPDMLPLASDSDLEDEPKPVQKPEREQEDGGGESEFRVMDDWHSEGESAQGCWDGGEVESDYEEAQRQQDSFKRKRPTVSPRRHRPRRLRGREPGHPVVNTIDFSEIYKNGKPDRPRIIVSYTSGRGELRWYILHCTMEGRTHKQVFGANGKDAVMAAGKHIESLEHGFARKTPFNVIRILGTRVLNCDTKMAKLNNDAVRAIMAVPSTSQTEAEDPYDDGSTASDTTTLSTSVICEPSAVGFPAPPLTVPDVGQPYVHAAPSRDPRQRDGTRRIVMVLPVGPFYTVGVRSGSFEDQLASNAPSCYKRGPDGKLLRHNRGLVWAPGYEDGGLLAHRRKYPVGYFQKDLDSWPVGWVLGTELRPFTQQRHRGGADAIAFYRIQGFHKKTPYPFPVHNPGATRDAGQGRKISIHGPTDSKPGFVTSSSASKYGSSATVHSSISLLPQDSQDSL